MTEQEYDQIIAEMNRLYGREKVEVHLRAIAQNFGWSLQEINWERVIVELMMRVSGQGRR